MTSKLQSLLKEKINENIKVHSSIDKNFSELDAYKVGKLEQLPMDTIKPNSAQPRLVFEESELNTLADSINELGLLQPIIVRQGVSSYEIVAGERRYRACKLLNKKYIDAIIINTTEENNILLALAENLSRANLTDFEIATSILQFKDKFPSRTEYAKALGISRQKLYKLLAFETLPEVIHEKLKINPELISADTAEKLNSLSKNITSNKNYLNEIILKGILLIEENQLKQANLIEYIQEQLIKCPNSDNSDLQLDSENYSIIPKESHIHRIYHNNGKPIGRMRSTRKKVIYELDVVSLDEEKKGQIEQFFDEIFKE